MVERLVDSISIERVLVTVFTILALLGLAKVGVLGWPAHPGVAAQGLYLITVLLLAFLAFSPIVMPMLAGMGRVSTREAWKWFGKFILGLFGPMLTAFLIFEWSGY